MSKHGNSFKHKVCEDLGKGLDEELCEEVAHHLEDCPDCRAQFDSVRQTVNIYKRVYTEKDEGLPSGIEERLLKVLSTKKT